MENKLDAQGLLVDWESYSSTGGNCMILRFQGLTETLVTA